MFLSTQILKFLWQRLSDCSLDNYYYPLCGHSHKWSPIRRIKWQSSIDMITQHGTTNGETSLAFSPLLCLRCSVSLMFYKYFSIRTCVTWRDVCDESVSWARDKALGNEMGRGADSWDLLLYHTLSLFIVSLPQSTDPKSHVTDLICWHDIGVNVTPAQCATLCVTAWYRSNLGPDYLTSGILWRRNQWPWSLASWIIP